MTQVKPQPTNIAAERAVLAGLCQHGSLSFTDVTEFLSVECFSKPINQNIFRCLEEAFKSSTKVDYPTIAVKAKEIGLTTLEDKTNQEYVVSLFNYPVEKETIKLNASSLKKLLLVRQAQNMIKDIYVKLGDISGSEKLSEILSMIEEPIYGFSNGVTKSSNDDVTKLLFEDIHEYIEHVVNNKCDMVGIPSPWHRYNMAIGGGRRRGGVYLISARTGVGKTTVCINDAIHVANRLKIPVLMLDTEMCSSEEKAKTLARLSNIPIFSIESGRLKDCEIDRLNTLGHEIKDIPFYYRQVAGKPFSEILSIIRNFVMQNVGESNGVTNDCLICYDYFKLMDSNGLKSVQEYQALGFQIQELTDFCKRYSVPCAAYAQLNRQEEIAMSDRMLWFCSSFVSLKAKSTEEMELDGYENGNCKFIFGKQRYGPGLPDNDYINILIQRDRCIVDEIGLKSEIDKDHQGFSDHDGDDDDESESF